VPSITRASSAVAVLGFCCLLWGISFPLMQFAMHRMAQASGLGDSIRGDLAVATTYNGWRFALTTLVYALALISHAPHRWWNSVRGKSERGHGGVPYALGIHASAPGGACPKGQALRAAIHGRTHPRNKEHSPHFSHKIAQRCEKCGVTIIGRGRISAESVRGGLCVGAFFSAGIVLQIVGLRFVLPSISGILTTLVVVFTPISQAWFLRRRVGAVTWCAVVIALIGTVILSLPNQAAVAQYNLVVKPPFPWFGEMLTIGCALMFTGQILTLDRIASVIDVRHLTWIMFATTAIVSMAIGLCFGGGAIFSGAVVKTLAADPLWLGATAILVVFSSAIAFHLMNVFQPRISPAAASVIYCLEPVFATAWSVLLGTEMLTMITFGGGAVVLAAVLLVARFGRDAPPVGSS
jgi:drug/metabolite transporter (DMT)-like permease